MISDSDSVESLGSFGVFFLNGGYAGSIITLNSFLNYLLAAEAYYYNQYAFLAVDLVVLLPI